MLRNTHSLFLIALSLMLPISGLVISGCSKSEPPTETGGLTPASASGASAELFQQRCQNCHGEKGIGGSGPNLTKVSARADADLFKTIHEGRGRMPAFGNQLTEAQVKELVAYVKGLERLKANVQPRRSIDRAAFLISELP